MAALLECAGGCAPLGALTERDVVRNAFPSAQGIREFEAGSEASSDYHLYVVDGGDGAIGYAVRSKAQSRSGTFTFLVILDSQFLVREVRILSYIGDRRGEVRSKGFTDRFKGKGSQDPIRVGQDIQAVTGATISSRAIADGVRRAIQLVEGKFSSLNR